MHIAISGCTSDETFLKVNNFNNELQSALNKVFKDDDYGPITRFLIVIVAVEVEEDENLKFCKSHNKSGTYTHPINRERVKYMSIAVPFNPDEILKLEAIALKKRLVDAIIARIEVAMPKIPKGMAYDAFTEKLITSLRIFAAAD